MGAAAGRPYRTSYGLILSRIGTVSGKRHLPRALELAERIARQAPLGVQATLQSARQAHLEGEAAAALALPLLAKKLLNSEDAKEGLRSLIEKRSGVFKGY